MLLKIKQIWSKNPTVVLVGVVLVLVLLTVLWGRIKEGFSYLIDSVKGSGSSLTSDEAKAIAASIFGEVNYQFSTDEDKIVEMVIPLSLSDYYKVQAAFGIVPYSATLDAFSSILGTDSNLTQVLNQTLESEHKEKIKQSAPWLPIS